MPRAVRLRGLYVGMAWLIVAIGVLAWRLLALPPRLIDVGAPGDGYAITNFYAAEQAGGTSFRWSGPSSAIRLPALPIDRFVMSLRMRGDLSTSPLYIWLSAQLPERLALPSSREWRVHHVLVDSSLPALQRTTRTINLIGELVQPLPHDARSLGAMLDWVRVVPLAPGLAAFPAAVGQSFLFVWVLLLLGGMLRLSAHALVPHSGTRQIALISWLPTAILTVALLGLAWIDPYALYWLLPLQPFPLLFATCGLGAAWGVWHVRARLRSRHLGWLPLLLGALLLAHGLLIFGTNPFWRGGAALLILWLPGSLLAWLWFRRESDLHLRILLGLCGALLGHLMIGLGFAALPGPISGPALILVCDLISLAAGLLLLRSPVPPPHTTVRSHAATLLLGIILLLAIGLRLPLLGSAELHDDEASVLIGASQLVAGQYEPLLTQLKGPAQMVLPAGLLAISGQLPEAVARLPFALAGVGVVLGGFVLGRALFGGVTSAGALVSAALLAIDGFLIGFARIVQYQSLVLLLTLVTLWCMLRFAATVGGERRILIAAALCYAAALLGHYDAIFVAPALACLLWSGGRQRRWRPADWSRQLLWPALLAIAVLAAFYIPFTLHPHFSKVIAHLGERTGQQDGFALYNNLPDSAALSGFYQSALQRWLVGGGFLLATIAAVLRAVRPWGLALLAAAVLGVAGGLLLVNPAALALPALLPAFGLPLGLLLCAARLSAGERAIWIWACSTWLAMMVLIALPRTHIYVAAIPTALLIGGAVGQLPAWDTLRRWLRPLLPPAIALLLLLASYQALLFVRPAPEYVRDYPAPLLFGAADTPIDPNARFGFPLRDGWKAIGELYRSGVLEGAFVSNQSSEVIAWYTGGMRRCDAEPTYAFIALAEPRPAIPPDAVLFGMVQVQGVNRIAIYRWNAPGAAPQVFPLEAYIDDFNARPIATIPPAAVVCAQAQP